MSAKPAPAFPSFQDFLTSPQLAGPWFSGASWDRWKVLWKAFDAQALSAADLEVFRALTGRGRAPARRLRELLALISRRTGKSIMSAARGAWLASCRDWSRYRKPGQRLHGLIYASDRDQAMEVMGYLAGFFAEIPALAAMVERGRGGKASTRRDEIRLVNGVTIRVAVANFRRLRGRTVIFAIADELCFWMDGDTSLNPASEVLRALRPGLLTTAPDSELLIISSKYRRQGVAWDLHRANAGRDDAPVLVAESDTLSMNPTIPREEVERAFREDPEAAKAEFGGLWRDDLESYVNVEAVAAVTMRGRLYLPSDARFRHTAFCDPAGGSGQDSMTVAIVRRERGKAVLCAVREWKPRFSPDQAIAEAAALLREYGVSRVVGDRWALGWPTDRFRFHGITYALADRTKSDFYIAFLPLVNGQRVELLDHPKTIAQLCSLERSSGKTGKDTVTHPPNGHDDLVNAVAGASVLAVRREMLAHEGEGERARRSAATPALDQYGAYEEVRVLDGKRVVFRVFPESGRAVPDRVAPDDEREHLVHSFEPCGTCGQSHIVMGGEPTECPRAEPWTPQELMRRAVKPTAHPDVRLIEEGNAANLALTARTIGWTG